METETHTEWGWGKDPQSCQKTGCKYHKFKLNPSFHDKASRVDELKNFDTATSNSENWMDADPGGNGGK